MSNRQGPSTVFSGYFRLAHGFYVKAAEPWKARTARAREKYGLGISQVTSAREKYCLRKSQVASACEKYGPGISQVASAREKYGLGISQVASAREKYGLGISQVTSGSGKYGLSRFTVTFDTRKGVQRKLGLLDAFAVSIVAIPGGEISLDKGPVPLQHSPRRETTRQIGWILIVRRFMRSLALLIVLVWATGCHPSQRKVDGPYRLELFDENGKFYLEKAGVEETGGGCIDGTVEEIGWTNGLIFARRIAISRSDPDGWMIINVAKQSIIGPLTGVEFRLKYPEVQTLSPEDAWKKL
jgi:hypothetical protein